MYRPIYDDGHRGLAVSADGSGREALVQKGQREPLLCDTCEKRLSVWEDHVARVWRSLGDRLGDKKPGDLVAQPGRYLELKLFTLSLFWRMSHSKHPNFAAVNLGEHEVQVREMLWNQTPGALDDYPSILFCYHGLDRLRGVIGIAGAGEWLGLPAFRIHISGLQWVFFAATQVAGAATQPLLAVSHRGLTATVSGVPESYEIVRMARRIFPNDGA